MKLPLQFMDGVEMNRLHPDTFDIPSDAEKAAILPGDFVKACFECPGIIGERMWIRVTSANEQGISGVLDNDPVGIPVHDGDFFTIQQRHVLAIMKAGHHE